MYNPMDQILTYLSWYFPLDYVALAVVALYIFVASLYGIFRVGVRFLGMQLFKIERGRTWPQAMLLCALLMMTIILSATLELTTLAPQYATFGSQSQSQVHGDQNHHPCGLNDLALATQASEGHPGGSAGCNMSQISHIVARITVSMPFFR